MRPDLIASQSRKSSSSSADTVSGSQPPASRSPTTFFLASQSDVDKASATQRTTEVHVPRSKSAGPAAVKHEEHGSTYGVQSLADTEDTVAGQNSSTTSPSSENDRQLSGESTLQRLLRIRKHDNMTSAGHPQDQMNQREPNSTPQELKRDGDDLALDSHQRNLSRTSITQPLTPLMTQAHSPFDSALPSTPKSASLRLSDEDMLTDDGCSQAIASSDEEDPSEDKTRSAKAKHNVTASPHGWAPQFVMPSLALPKRKPFTTIGRRIGRFKICVAGASGVGKSKLIHAIISQCEHIVHVDSLVTSYTKVMHASTAGESSRTALLEEGPTSRLTEIHASTRAYPTWWTDGEETRVLRRRKSMEDVVLERNLCLVDTPGLQSSETSSPAFDYVEAQLRRNVEVAHLEDNELLAVLTGAGGMQVDLVLYLIAHDATLSDEVERIRRLSELTNVLPLIGHADLLDDASLLKRKTDILEALRSGGVRPYLIGGDIDGLLNEMREIGAMNAAAICSSTGESTQENPGSTAVLDSGRSIQNLPPFAISAIPADDIEMDASLLMKSTYSTPLSPSELPELLHAIFEPDTIQSLRHSAVRKFLLWRRTSPSSNRDNLRDSNSMLASDTTLTSARRQISRALSTPLPGNRLSRPTTPGRVNFGRFQLTVPDLTPPVGLSESTTVQLRDHTLREGRRAQIQLARWATDLQRAVQVERDHFENLVEADRARWLLDRLGEEVRRGSVGLVDAEGITRRFASRTDRANMDIDNLRSLEGGLQQSSTSTKRMSRRKAALPPWAQTASRRSAHKHDRNYGLRQTTSTVLKLAGGSVLITAAYFIISGLLQKPDAALSKSIQSPSWFAPPAWVMDVMARWVWPLESQQDIWT